MTKNEHVELFAAFTGLCASKILKYCTHNLTDEEFTIGNMIILLREQLIDEEMVAVMVYNACEKTGLGDKLVKATAKYVQEHELDQINNVTGLRDKLNNIINGRDL